MELTGMRNGCGAARRAPAARTGGGTVCTKGQKDDKTVPLSPDYESVFAADLWEALWGAVLLVPNQVLEVSLRGGSQ